MLELQAGKKSKVIYRSKKKQTGPKKKRVEQPPEIESKMIMFTSSEDDSISDEELQPTSRDAKLK